MLADNRSIETHPSGRGRSSSKRDHAIVLFAGPVLEELLEVFKSKTSVPNDAAHRVLIDWIVARDGQNATTVTHHNVLALVDDPKARLF